MEKNTKKKESSRTRNTRQEKERKDTHQDRSAVTVVSMDGEEKEEGKTSPTPKGLNVPNFRQRERGRLCILGETVPSINNSSEADCAILRDV